MKGRFNQSLMVFLCLILTAATACQETGSADGESSDDSTSSSVFPTDLAVASPFAYTSDEEASESVSTRSHISGHVPQYTWATGRVDMILDGATAALCTFDPELFLSMPDDADCYGPVVEYEDHPDWTAASPKPADGELPPGDVGLWIETDATTGHACSAAELNAQMEGISDQSLASLMGLASMVCVVNTSGYSMPSSSTLDLTADMNALGIADVTFASAILSHEVAADGNDLYSYELDLTYAPGSDSHHIVVALDHVSTSTEADYYGRLAFRVNDTTTGGNCPSSDVTYNGSLLYDSDSKTEMKVDARFASYCEHDSDGTTDGLVDPSLKYDVTSNPTGWGDNFGLLVAEYDPSSLEGNYTYTWQAGPLDDNSRSFNINVTSSTSVTSFYGYGDDIETADGSISGFICNWAGPEGIHTLQDFAQYQTMSYNSSTGVVESTGANIAYAPVNDCEYDGTGTFAYDSDIDGVVDTDPATAVGNDLMALTDSDGNGVFDEIEGAGFDIPTAPTNF